MQNVQKLVDEYDVGFEAFQEASRKWLTIQANIMTKMRETLSIKQIAEELDVTQHVVKGVLDTASSLKK